MWLTEKSMSQEEVDETRCKTQDQNKASFLPFVRPRNLQSIDNTSVRVTSVEVEKKRDLNHFDVKG